MAEIALKGDNEEISESVEMPVESTQDETEQRKAARRYRWRLIMGLLLPSVLEALDTTIIAAALSFIASEFNDLSQLSWIANAFNITACAFIPAFGQLADLFGRHTMLQVCQILVLVGSALAAGAQEFVMLLFGRALQGVGCAGILVLVRIILADRVSLAENSKNTSIYSMVAGCAYAVAPVIGGYLTEVSWRWVFIINAPLGVAGIVITWWLLRKVLVGPREEVLNTAVSKPKKSIIHKLSQIDFGGQLIFLTGTTLFILAIIWGGSSHSWNSFEVLVSLILGSSLFLIFPIYEYFMTPGKLLARLFPRQTAMIPFHVLATRNVGFLCFINICTGMAMYGVLFFTSIYFTLVSQFSASESGVRLLFYLPGLGVGTYITLYLCLTSPRSTYSPLLLGSMIEAVGITVLIPSFRHGHLPTIYGMMFLTGVGTGMRFMPSTLHGVGFFPDTIAPVVSLLEFMIFFGGTIVLPVMNSVFNNKLSAGTGVYFEVIGHGGSLDSIAKLPTETQTLLREQAGKAVMWAFVTICPFMWVAVLVAASLGTVYLDTDGQTLRGEGEGGDAIRSKKGVIEGSYLVDLWVRYVQKKDRKNN